MNNQYIKEIREEFNIPPFVTDGTILIWIKDAKGYLEEQIKDIDYENDRNARVLLKYYVFYAYNNRIADFENDFQSRITAWKFNKISGEDENND